MKTVLNSMNDNRNTRQKTAIRDAVSVYGIHRTAEEIHALVHKDDSSVGLATVYRNLKRMCDEGSIQRLSVNGTYYYDANPEPHDHFLCRKCGKLIDLPDEYDERMDEKIAQRTGAAMVTHTVMYEGVCSNCQKNEGRK